MRRVSDILSWFEPKAERWSVIGVADLGRLLRLALVRALSGIEGSPPQEALSSALERLQGDPPFFRARDRAALDIVEWMYDDRDPTASTDALIDAALEDILGGRQIITLHGLRAARAVWRGDPEGAAPALERLAHWPPGRELPDFEPFEVRAALTFHDEPRRFRQDLLARSALQVVDQVDAPVALLAAYAALTEGSGIEALAETGRRLKEAEAAAADLIVRATLDPSEEELIATVLVFGHGRLSLRAEPLAFLAGSLCRRTLVAAGIHPEVGKHVTNVHLRLHLGPDVSLSAEEAEAYRRRVALAADYVTRTYDTVGHVSNLTIEAG